MTRIAHEIVEGNADLSRVALVGIHTRGVPLAQRLRRRITGRNLEYAASDFAEAAWRTANTGYPTPTE